MIRVHAVISELGFGGAETLLVDLAAAASEVGIDLSVSYLRAGESQATAGWMAETGVDPVLVPFRRLVRLDDHRALRRHLAAVRPDIVHTHLRTADVAGGIAARSLSIPQVATLHGFDWGPHDVRTGPRARGAGALVMLARRRLPRRLVAVSAAVERDYLTFTGDDPRRVVTIHGGSGRRAKPGSGAAVRAELGIAADRFVIAMVSWLHPLKRHALAIEAAARLRGATLLVVGDGPEAERLRHTAEQLAPDTVFTGLRRDVMELLDASDVLLHPSRMEGFPITLLEAMAAGVPIVATRVGGTPEVVEDGDSGILLDAGVTADGIAAVLTALQADPARRTRLADSARRRFEERFTADRWARRLRDFYAAELER